MKLQERADGGEAIRRLRRPARAVSFGQSAVEVELPDPVITSVHPPLVPEHAPVAVRHRQRAGLCRVMDQRLAAVALPRAAHHPAPSRFHEPLPRCRRPLRGIYSMIHCWRARRLSGGTLPELFQPSLINDHSNKVLFDLRILLSNQRVLNYNRLIRGLNILKMSRSASNPSENVE